MLGLLGFLMIWGGVEQPDGRMKDILKLLEFAPNKSGMLLDIGVGKGQISSYFLNNPLIKHIEGIGLEVDSYGLPSDLFKKNFHLTECSVEKMPFDDESFDIAVASHIFEHVSNMGLALKETRRVLKEDGWLYIFIPKYESMVLAGHINTGWNIGQLMYVLLIHGFDVKNGKFIEYGYSLCAYVQKKEFEIPALRGDRGDIVLIERSHLLPCKIGDHGYADGLQDGFFGEIAAINWDNANKLLKEKFDEDIRHFNFAKKASLLLARFMFAILGRDHTRGFAQLLNKLANHIVNPSEL